MNKAFEELKTTVKRASIRSQYRVSLSPGLVLSLINAYEELENKLDHINDPVEHGHIWDTSSAQTFRHSHPRGDESHIHRTAENIARYDNRPKVEI